MSQPVLVLLRTVSGPNTPDRNATQKHLLYNMSLNIPQTPSTQTEANTCFMCVDATDLKWWRGTAERLEDGSLDFLACTSHQPELTDYSVYHDMIDSTISELSARHSETHPELSQQLTEFCELEQRFKIDVFCQKMSDIAKTIGVDLEPWLNMTEEQLHELTNADVQQGDDETDKSLLQTIINNRQALDENTQKDKKRVYTWMWVSASENGL